MQTFLVLTKTDIQFKSGRKQHNWAIIHNMPDDGVIEIAFQHWAVRLNDPKELTIEAFEAYLRNKVGSKYAVFGYDMNTIALEDPSTRGVLNLLFNNNGNQNP